MVDAVISFNNSFYDALHSFYINCGTNADTNLVTQFTSIRCLHFFYILQKFSTSILEAEKINSGDIFSGVV